MIRNRLNVVGNGVIPTRSGGSPPEAITAKKKGTPVHGNFLPSSVGAPISVATFGGPSYTTMFNGILPESNEQLLLPYYRDMYYHDAVAGASVDITSSFPFSDFTLAGLDSEDLQPFTETVARLNVRALTQEISAAYLVDSAFVGTLILDSDSKAFQDVLVHDYANVSVTPQPFYSLDPVITVNTAAALNQFFNQDSPYVESSLSSYPQPLIDTFRSGTVVLDPLTSLYLPRKGLQDKTSVSYLKRLLPIYMLEKVLYRGTLIEASKRQRSTSHIMVGDDTWEPTIGEMTNILSQFQQTELDPLGAWIVTRNGVSVNEVRAAGDFWKWTETIETLTPFKLRGLGISEAFLSGDASYATAEAAISVFMDNMDAYRQFLTYKIFSTKIFPLIAVFHGLYKDPKRAKNPNSAADIMYNVSNQKNLKIPTVRWHKSLEGNDADSQFDLLEKLSGKGFSIPLKMWAAAANVDIGGLLTDLQEDEDIKRRISEVTGRPADDIGIDDGSGEEQFAHRMISGSYPAKVKSRRVPLLAREFDDMSASSRTKSGNGLKPIYNANASKARLNDLLVKASMALRDPNHRESVRKSVNAKLGSQANMNITPRGTR